MSCKVDSVQPPHSHDASFQRREKYLFLNDRPVVVLNMSGDVRSIPSSIRRSAVVRGNSIIWPSLLTSARFPLPKTNGFAVIC